MPDVTPPAVSNQVPAPGASGVLPSTPISFDILDSGLVAVGEIDIPFGAQFRKDELTAPGGTSAFAFQPYEPGQIEVWVDGLLQQITETDPNNGIVTILGGPVALGAVVSAFYLPQFVLVAVDISTVVIRVDGVVAFSAPLGFQGGFSGAVIPMLGALGGGFHFAVTHPDFTQGPHVVSVDGADLAVPPNAMVTVTWSFFARSSSMATAQITHALKLYYNVTATGTGVQQSIASVVVTDGPTVAGAPDRYSNLLSQSSNPAPGSPPPAKTEQGATLMAVFVPSMVNPLAGSYAVHYEDATVAPGTPIVDPASVPEVRVVVTANGITTAPNGLTGVLYIRRNHSIEQ